jgi:hypothetical protein
MENRSLPIYPNPVNKFICFDKTITGEYACIYDNSGKMILNSVLKDENCLNAGILEEGIYFLTIYNGSRLSFSGRFIKTSE